MIRLDRYGKMRGVQPGQPSEAKKGHSESISWALGIITAILLFLAVLLALVWPLLPLLPQAVR